MTAAHLDGAPPCVALGAAVRSREPGGTLWAGAWRPRVEDVPMSGGAAHETVRAAAGLGHPEGCLDEDAVLEVMMREESPVRSVAAKEGLA